MVRYTSGIYNKKFVHIVCSNSYYLFFLITLELIILSIIFNFSIYVSFQLKLVSYKKQIITLFLNLQ